MERHETSGVTMRLVVEYVRACGGEAALPRLLALAGEQRSLARIEDEHEWSTYDQKIALLSAAAELLGQPDVAVQVGRSVLHANVAGSLKLLLNLVGSPAQLLRGIARTCQKFSTAAVMEAREVRSTSAVVTYRLLPGYRTSRFDCDLNIGLLSQASALFGLPPAAVEHVECQVHGAARCVYRLRWARHRRLLRRRQRAGVSGQVLADRLDALQATVADLVSVSSVGDVLTHIARGARRAVSAPHFLLVAALAPGSEPQVHGDGLSVGEAARLAEELRDTGAITSVETEVLIVPVRTARRDYGWLVALGFSDQGFLDREPELLRAYGELAGAALDVVTAQHEALQQRDTAEVLLSLARALLQVQTEAEVAQTVAEHALSVIGSDRATALLYDPVAEQLTVAAHAGWPPNWQEALRRLVVRPQEIHALQRMVAAPGAPRFYDSSVPDAGLRVILEQFQTPLLAVAPMATGEQLLGVLIAAWTTPRPEVLGDEHLMRRLRGLADQAAGSLERARLLEQVQRQATTDELTGLANRRRLTEHLDELLSRDRGCGHALLYLDLDRFKSVNDTLGHTAGDELLADVGAALRAQVGEQDLVARLGGDEFVVVRAGVADDDAARQVAERLHVAIDQRLDAAARKLGVRASVGYVLLDHDCAAQVLQEADSAMYGVKRVGRAGPAPAIPRQLVRE